MDHPQNNQQIMNLMSSLMVESNHNCNLLEQQLSQYSSSNYQSIAQLLQSQTTAKTKAQANLHQAKKMHQKKIKELNLIILQNITLDNELITKRNNIESNLEERLIQEELKFHSFEKGVFTLAERLKKRKANNYSTNIQYGREKLRRLQNLLIQELETQKTLKIKYVESQAMDEKRVLMESEQSKQQMRSEYHFQPKHIKKDQSEISISNFQATAYLENDSLLC